MKKHRPYLVFWLLLCLMAPIAQAQEAGFFNSTFGDFAEELENARDGGKQAILIMFEMEDCPFCQRMKQMVLSRPEVQAYFRAHFLQFMVDIEGDIELVDFKGETTTEKDFAFKQHRVRATPVFMFFDLNGEPIPGARFTGATSGAEEFLLFGRYVTEKAYENTTFTRYKRENRPG